MITQINYGWVCPICGNSLNPSLKYCILCYKKKEKEKEKYNNWLTSSEISKKLNYEVQS